MPQSLAKIWVHLIFSTKSRYPFPKDKEIRNQMHAYISGICRQIDSPSLRVGGIEDHVHVLCELSKDRPLTEAVREIKRDSSKWIKTKGGVLRKFYWQTGYGAFSVSPSQIEQLRDYIAYQEVHHQKMTFQEEFRKFLTKWKVAYDERYVWD